jgi:hypothetical protein
MNTIAQTALEMVSDWTANDGGLTMAAADLIWLGGALDVDLSSVDTTEKAMALMDEFCSAIWNTGTGTESDLYAMAIDSLRGTPLYQEGERLANLAKLRQEALARRHWLPR